MNGVDRRCVCTFEGGDTDCAVHPTCAACAHPLVNTELTDYVMRLEVAISTLRGKLEEARRERDQWKARTLEAQSDRDIAWQDRDAQVEAKKRVCAAIEREMADQLEVSDEYAATAIKAARQEERERIAAFVEDNLHKINIRDVTALELATAIRANHHADEAGEK